MRVEDEYWLVHGEEHLAAMLSLKPGFPVPVGCIRFPSHTALEAMLGEGEKATDYWAINPKIVERLRLDNQLLEIVAGDG